MKAKKVKKLTIGKIYAFNYHSDSKSRELKDPVKILLSDEVINNVLAYIKKNKKSMLKRLADMTEKANEIINCSDKDLQAVLKEEFKEQFTTSFEEKTPERQAQSLFFRAYIPENIEHDKDGNIQAIFMGNDVTVTGKTTYKWLVVSDVRVEREKINDENKKYLIMEEV